MFFNNKFGYGEGSGLIKCDEFPDHTVSASEGEEEEENEFYDALGGESGNIATAALPETSGSFTLNIPTGTHRRNSSDSSDETDEARETQKVIAIM